MDPTAERKCQWSGQGIEVPAGQLPGKLVLVGGCLREDGKDGLVALTLIRAAIKKCIEWRL